MNKIISIKKPDEIYEMYISEIGIKPNTDYGASIYYKLTTNKELAIKFDNDDELKLAFNIVNLYNKKFYKTYKLNIIEV